MILNMSESVSGRRRCMPWLSFLLLAVAALWSSSAEAGVIQQRQSEPIAGGMDLRILAIGDSITWGGGSGFCPVGTTPSKCNGYRKSVYTELTRRGNKVTFVGGLNAGDFAQTANEGHRGKRIDEITEMSTVGIAAKPNVVLLNAGTNDVKDQMEDFPQAHKHLTTLIENIYDASPDALVLLSTIIHSTRESTKELIKEFNAKIPAIVEKFEGEEKKIALVDMYSVIGVEDLADDLHPSLAGYEKMAQAWLSALEENQSVISEPVAEPAVTTVSSSTAAFSTGTLTTKTSSTTTRNSKCEVTPYWKKKVTFSEGSEYIGNDGPLKASWSARRRVKYGTCPRDRVQFMDLDGDGRKDYACVDPKTGSTSVQLNIADGQWKDVGVVTTSAMTGSGASVKFADLNGDGRDDILRVGSNGDIQAWLNQGPNGGSWSWKSLGIVARGTGATPANVQFADVDGDRRHDICVVGGSSVTVWLNAGARDSVKFQKAGVMGEEMAKGDTDKVILADMSGDGRADYMIATSRGRIDGSASSQQEQTLIPLLSPVVAVHPGGNGASRDSVRLADLTGDGKADYIYLDSNGGILLSENMGKGAKYQAGEGVFLRDLDGDGTSDVVWFDPNGRGFAYLNRGEKSGSWASLGQIADAGVPRERVRMGVMTKSGRADYIVLDESNGRAVWYRNTGGSGGVSWASGKQIATGPKNTVESKYGWKFRAENIRFADLSGDGLDDFVYVNEYGATLMWENRGTDIPDFKGAKLVAAGPSVGVLGSEVHFADTNGDGLLDFVVVDRMSGRVRVWTNQGMGSSGIRWSAARQVSSGLGNVGLRTTLFADMTGDGRADYVSVNPDSGNMGIWENVCSA